MNFSHNFLSLTPLQKKKKNSFSIHWKLKTPSRNAFVKSSISPHRVCRLCLCGSILNAETERSLSFLSPLLPAITQSFLLSEGSLQMTRTKHVQRTCCSNDTIAVTDGSPRTAETFWCTLRTMCYSDESCSYCLLSASRPTSLTGTLSTTSMRTTPQTFGNFQSKTIVNALHSRVHCIHAGARTYLQWSCKDSCWGLHWRSMDAESGAMFSCFGKMLLNFKETHSEGDFRTSEGWRMFPS